MSKNKFNELKSVISELREKCPWDKNQTFQSLRSLTIEEVYELSEAIINQDPKNIEEEAGDLLLHICLLYTSPSPRDATLSRMPSSA